MEELLKLGWREWCNLPELGIPAIKAKIDTGAKTSALHAFKVERFEQNNQAFVRFSVHPVQKNETVQIECIAPIKDERVISDSGGHKEIRYIIETQIVIGNKSWPIEMSLTNRDCMRFRMLLGRRAMKDLAIVDPTASYLNGKLKVRSIYGLRPAGENS